MQGMEPDIQRLLAKHKAELQVERDKGQESSRSVKAMPNAFPWAHFLMQHLHLTSMQSVASSATN